MMEKEYIMETIKKLVNSTSSSIRVYLVQNGQQDNICYLFPNALHESIKKVYRENFNNFIIDRTISDYDNVHTEKGTIQKASLGDVDVWTKVKAAIDVVDKGGSILTKNNFSDEFHMIVICFEDTINMQIKQTYLVAQYKKVETWYKKSVKFGFVGDTFREKSEDIFVLNGCIDCAIFGENAFILQESSFERLFKYNKKMRTLLKDNRENIESCSFLDDPVAFNELILKNKAATKYMARFFQKQYFNLSTLEPTAVKAALNGHEEFAAIQYDKNDKIIVDKKSRYIIVDIITGKYLRSLFGENIVQTKGV